MNKPTSTINFTTPDGRTLSAAGESLAEAGLAFARAHDPLERDSVLRGELVAREALAYAACSGLVKRVWRAQKDDPTKAVKTILLQLQKWTADCDALTAELAGDPEPSVSRWRLTRAGVEAVAAGAGR